VQRRDGIAGGLGQKVDFLTAGLHQLGAIGLDYALFTTHRHT